jgi:hypothetical protein
MLSESFCLSLFDGSSRNSWSKDPQFKSTFLEFAVANGSGSSYAFWLCNKELSACAIVVFGDEGGIHVVAQSISEWLLLLTFDCEISVSHDSAYFYREEDDIDYEPSDSHIAFTNFVRDNINKQPLTSMTECDAIVEAAREQYQAVLETLVAKYVA